MKIALALVTNRHLLTPWWAPRVRATLAHFDGDACFIWVDSSYRGCVNVMADADTLGLVSSTKHPVLRLQVGDTPNPCGVMRNHAIALARAQDCDAFVFVDDDDWWDPCLLERLASAPSHMPALRDDLWLYLRVVGKHATSVVSLDHSRWAPLSNTRTRVMLPGTLLNLRCRVPMPDFDSGRACSDVRMLRNWRTRFEGWCPGLGVPNDTVHYVAVRHSENTGNTHPIVGSDRRPPFAQALPQVAADPAWRTLQRLLQP